MGNETKYIYDSRGRIKKEYKDTDILEPINSNIESISEIFANMIMKEGYDKIQLQEYITSHLEYEMLYYLNNKISGK